MGVMGMTLGDFCRLTPQMFAEACRARADHAEACRRDAWERMRLATTIAIQPHVKKKIQATELLPLPWDKARQAPPVSAAEDRRRLQEVMKRGEMKRGNSSNQ